MKCIQRDCFWGNCSLYINCNNSRNPSVDGTIVYNSLAAHFLAVLLVQNQHVQFSTNTSLVCRPIFVIKLISSTILTLYKERPSFVLNESCPSVSLTCTRTWSSVAARTSGKVAFILCSRRPCLRIVKINGQTYHALKISRRRCLT